MSESSVSKQRIWPACIGVEEASKILGWPTYYFPVLMRTGHLKPLGKPAQNSRKWFATAEVERLSRDLAWLDKAVRMVEKHVRDSNAKQRSGASTKIEADSLSIEREILSTS